MNDFPQRLDRRIIYESSWVSLYVDRVRMPSGAVVETYHRIHYPRESVCVVIVNERDEILMIRSKRYATGRLEWEVPAGRIEDGETPEEAATREAREETGCTIRSLKAMGKFNPANGMSDLTMHMFLAQVDTQQPDYDHDEVADVHWMTRQQVLEILRSNETQCGVSMLTLSYALQFYLDA